MHHDRHGHMKKTISTEQRPCTYENFSVYGDVLHSARFIRRHARISPHSQVVFSVPAEMLDPSHLKKKSWSMFLLCDNRHRNHTGPAQTRGS